jgi:sec-independent protein translocase protein TatA
MGLSIWHILVVLLVVMLVFGTRRLPGTMEDLAKGLKAFKRAMKEDYQPGAPVELIETSKDK